MSTTDILLERETANDELALIVKVFAPTGKPVQKDELLFEIETSKAVRELRAPEAGILKHHLEAGQAVDFGVPIAQVVSVVAWEQVGAHGTAIVLERETANDESAIVVAIHINSGTAVEKNELILEIETSKAVQELYAPEAGILLHQLVIRQTVSFGVPIAWIVAKEDVSHLDSQLESPGQESNPRPRQGDNLVRSQNGGRPLSALFEGSPPSSPRAINPQFSRAAAALMSKHGLSPGLFTADFVTSRDVRLHLEPTRPESFPAQPLRRPLETVESRQAVQAKQGQEVSLSKRTEIEVLRKGAGETLLSVLGVSIGHLLVAREPGDFLNGRITDLVIYEAARLMKKYPLLNSFYADGQIFMHEAIHAGLAIDGGGRLIVYGIENADRATLHDLSDTMASAVERYLEDQLTGAEMSRATFTVTDLSADELDFVLPLLPRGQSCILGITHCEQSGFRVFAGFDHRVTEGRMVGAFLGELRKRLLTFSSIEAETSRCVYCERTAAESAAKGNEKGLLKTVDRKGQEVLCCGSCWNGW
jgi:pyruvate dehydrogenase E2 component (dihydrolipoamide acetyltransferase)